MSQGLLRVLVFRKRKRKRTGRNDLHFYSATQYCGRKKYHPTSKMEKNASEIRVVSFCFETDESVECLHSFFTSSGCYSYIDHHDLVKLSTIIEGVVLVDDADPHLKVLTVSVEKPDELWCIRCSVKTSLTLRSLRDAFLKHGIEISSSYDNFSYTSSSPNTTPIIF